MSNNETNSKQTCNGLCKFVESMFSSYCTTCGADDMPSFEGSEPYDNPPPPETNDSHFS